MARFLMLAIMIACLVPVSAKSDRLCPGGSLSEFNTQAAWDQYRDRSFDYLDRWHKRLSRRLMAILDADDLDAQIAAAAELGRDHTLLMQRIFEEGYIAASDLVFAYCYKVPDSEPWNEDIKRKRREAWCRKEPTAHFCPK